MATNPLFSPEIWCENCNQLLSSSIDLGGKSSLDHPHLNKLPDWPAETIAVLGTMDEVPHAIPVTSPLRIGDRQILFALKRGRDSLGRLRKYPRAALLILSAGDLAFTARGRAYIVQEPMSRAPTFAAVAIDVEEIDDHRQPGLAVTSGVGLDWANANTQRFLRAHDGALRDLAASGSVPNVMPLAKKCGAAAD